MPGLTVVGEQEFELELAGIVGNGVADDDAVLGIPEGHRVEESFGIGVGELKLPVLSGVGGVVDAGMVAGTADIRKASLAEKATTARKSRAVASGTWAGFQVRPPSTVRR